MKTQGDFRDTERKPGCQDCPTGSQGTFGSQRSVRLHLQGIPGTPDAGQNRESNRRDLIILKGMDRNGMDRKECGYCEKENPPSTTKTPGPQRNGFPVRASLFPHLPPRPPVRRPLPRQARSPPHQTRLLSGSH